MPQTLARVMTSEEVMTDAFLLQMECPEIAACARPGQFLMVGCGRETLLRRPLSVHRANVTQGTIALLFHVVGKGTRWLAERKPGETLDLLGPLGNGFTTPETAKKLLLVAGGIGIAPLVFLAEEAIKQGKEVVLFMGAKNAACLLPDTLLPSGAKIVHTTEDGSAGFQGIVTAAWADMHLQYPGFHDIQDIFACGPLPMYQSIRELPNFNDKHVQISLEMRMACGLGLCYGCTVRTTGGLRQVCRDGPVFNLPEIIFDALTLTT